MDEPDGFGDFVRDRSALLLRTAWLLTGDWHLAEDLVQTALTKTLPRWSKITRREAPEVFVRRVLLTTFLSWRTRRWIGEIPARVLPEKITTVDEHAVADVRVALLAAVRRLPPRQRAVIALRFFEDLTEANTALAMGCSVGTVKSHTSRALDRLRDTPGLTHLLTEEVAR